MERISKGSVPEGHDRIAHVFVDRSTAFHDVLGEGSEETIDEGGQALRIVLVRLGNCRETTNIREEHGQLALLAAEGQLFRRLRQLLHKVGREILTESRPDPITVRGNSDIVRADQNRVNEKA